MPRSGRTPVCVNCKEADLDAEGIFDMYGRFWCVDCLIFVLGELQPPDD